MDKFKQFAAFCSRFEGILGVIILPVILTAIIGPYFQDYLSNSYPALTETSAQYLAYGSTLFGLVSSGGAVLLAEEMAKTSQIELKIDKIKFNPNLQRQISKQLEKIIGLTTSEPSANFYRDIKNQVDRLDFSEMFFESLSQSITPNNHDNELNSAKSTLLEIVDSLEDERPFLSKAGPYLYGLVPPVFCFLAATFIGRILNLEKRYSDYNLPAPPNQRMENIAPETKAGNLKTEIYTAGWEVPRQVEAPESTPVVERQKQI